MEDDLVDWGKVIRLRTTGHRSGAPRTVTVGFVEADDGALLVAASSDGTSWASNLSADPACFVERDDVGRAYTAVRLRTSERAAAITGLILKYGTPAERLGAGPAFRLEPRPAVATDRPGNVYTGRIANKRSR
jgi:deazaflavin-dependent oxidoreductase (nitroreductase family)